MSSKAWPFEEARRLLKRLEAVILLIAKRDLHEHARRPVQSRFIDAHAIAFDHARILQGADPPVNG